MTTRASGILLHVTSLPSPYGIGDLGPEAYRFVDFLEAAQQTVWQVLPLNPTDGAHGNSPYSSSSAFAGNRLLINPDRLIADGYLNSRDLQPAPDFDDERVAFEDVTAFKSRLLDLAWAAFHQRTDHHEFDHFCHEQSAWLDDYALFMTLKALHGGEQWNLWPDDLRDRKPEALEAVRSERADAIDRIKFEQFLFFSQWTALKEYANSQGIQILGDLPIYVNYDSSDTWSHPEIFKLNGLRRPAVVSGVPPDYFSKTGQLWGNPVYDWEVLRSMGYRWWLERLEHVLRQFDLVRIDHFRGLVAFWEVPYGNETAIEGNWQAVPVDDFLTALKNHFGTLPVIAEDLGTITEDVTATMKRYGFPGMKVLMFAFSNDDPNHPYRPHTYDENSVVYTGTHDNNTIVGWYTEDADPDEKRRLAEYLGGDVPPDRICEALIRLALRSPARLAIVPMQDVLGLSSSARMNRPAIPNGNWTWRMNANQCNDALAGHLATLVEAANRQPLASCRLSS